MPEYIDWFLEVEEYNDLYGKSERLENAIAKIKERIVNLKADNKTILKQCPDRDWNNGEIEGLEFALKYFEGE